MIKTLLSLCNKNKFFLIIASVFFLLQFIVENSNGKFWLNDFKVYYLAAEAMLKGEKIYGESFGLGSGYYKYSPFILNLFVPFTFFPYYFASVIQFVLISFSTLLTVFGLHQLLTKYVFTEIKKASNGLLLISILCIVRQLVRELHLGNVNVLILVSLCFYLLFALKEKQFISALFLGFVILLKPYFILLFIPLILCKKYKTIVYLFSVLGISVLFCCVFLGIVKTYDLHIEWVNSIVNHNETMQSNETVFSIFQYFFNTKFPIKVQWFFVLIFLVFYSGLFIFKKKNFTNKSEYNSTQFFIISQLVLIALIPNLLITDTEHFMFSLPLIMYILYYVSLNRNKWNILFFCVLVFFFVGNSSDILGKELSQYLDKMGVLGITNLSFIVWAIIILFKKNKARYVESDKLVRIN